MRTIVQVVCSQGDSLRDRIVNDDARLRRLGLEVLREKKPGRNPGWAKLGSRDRGFPGVINLRWDAETRTLLCHVVTKGAGKPNAIIARFTEYLLVRHLRRIKVINVFAR